MIWACMGWNGPRILAEVEGRMNSQQYIDILEDFLGRSIEKLEIPEKNVIFQQDRDTV